MRHLVLAVSFAPLALLAMPSRAELEKVQPLVNEMMAEDVAAQKAGRMTSAQVAEHALKLVDQAESEAAKYLLLNGAFNNFANARDFDRAAKTLTRIRATISNVPPETIRQQILRVLHDRRHGGMLSEMLVVVQAEMRYSARLAQVRGKLAGGIRTPQLLKEEADCLALSGQWKDALDAFAKLGRTEAAVVAFEREGSGALSALDVGDFWWNYASDIAPKDEPCAFRFHALPFYRMALEDGKIKGLQRSVLEKRIAQMEQTGLAQIAPPQAKSSTGISVTAGAVRMFRLSNKVDLEMVACPAGTFTMGRRGDTAPKSLYREHQVTITRPFWIGKIPVTIGQLKQVLPKDMSALWHVLYGDAQVLNVGVLSPGDMRNFFNSLNARFKSKIPRGYVFRLPTEAEWEYACRANSTRPDDPYGWLWGTGDAERSLSKPEISSRISFRCDDFERPGKWEAVADLIRKRGNYHPFIPFGPAGLRQPNAWGIHDLICIPSKTFKVDSGEVVLDVFPCAAHIYDPRPAKPRMYADQETDPLHFTPGEASIWSSSSGGPAHLSLGSTEKRVGTGRYRMRLVLGPDLLKEKGLKLE